MPISGIYKIENTLTGKCYVGSAVDIDARWRAHRHTLRHHKKAPPKLQRAWDKYGESAFSFLVLEQCPREDTLLREQWWIDELCPYYNTRMEAASNLGVTWSEATNDKKARKDTRRFAVRGVAGSLRELCRHFGVVGVGTAVSRIKRGASVEDAVTQPPVGKAEIGRRAAATHKRNNTHPSAKNLTAFGVTGSLTELVKKFSKQKYGSVQARIKRGVPLEDALTTPFVAYADRKQPAPEQHPMAKRMTYQGVTASVAALAEKFSTVSATCVRRRLRSGWALEAALETPVGGAVVRYKRGKAHHLAKPITVRDVTGTLAEFSALTGTPYETIQWRINNGWPLEKAVFTPSRKKAA